MVKLQFDKKTATRLFFYANVLVCFLLPMNGKLLAVLGVESQFNLLPISLGLMFFLSFFTTTFNFKKVLKNKFFKLFAAFFLMYIVSALMLGNSKDAFGVLLKKLVLVSVPIAVFSNAGFYVRRAPQFFYAFFSGVLLTLLVLDFGGIYAYFTKGSFPFYIAYSKMLHPSYLGLNVLLLLLMNLYRFGEEELTWKKYFQHLVFLFFFLLHLFLLLSKGVIIITGISMVGYLVVLLQKNLKKGLAYLSFWMLPVLMFMIVSFGHKGFHDSLVSRFSDLLAYNQSQGSTSFRASMIKQAPQILEDNWILGVGAGQEQVYLDEYYKQTDWVYAWSHSYNTHNQFLQTWLGIGIAGLFLFCTILLGPFMLSIDPVIKMMLFCFVFLFCTEAMLERQAGITLFIIFYSLFIGLTRPRQMKAKKRVLTFS